MASGVSSILGLARGGVTALWNWWLAELAGMLPRKLKQLGRRDKHQLVLLLSADEIVVLERSGNRAHVIGSAANGADDRDAQLRTLLQRAKGRRQPVALSLSGAFGLRKVVNLPLAARDDLNQLLRLEMDRLTPFTAEQVYFAQRIIETDPQNRRIVVELAVAPRNVVDQALQTAQALGVVPARLELGTSHVDGREPLNLLPQQSTDGGGERRLVRGLIVLALALAVVAVAIPLQRQRSKLDALTEQIALTKEAAEQSYALREQLDQLTQTGYFLLAEKNRRSMATEVIAELTRLVPDQAYLEQLLLQDGDVQLYGSAATASDLIGLLDQSPLFRAPQFRSPVTQDGRDGTERFHVSVELVEEE